MIHLFPCSIKFNSCFKDVSDLYTNDGMISRFAVQSQPNTTDNLETIPPTSNIVQPSPSPIVASSQSASQPVSLGLGLPPQAGPATRQSASDSMRRRVTPIPSGQSAPPILDHTSGESEVLKETPPPSPDPPANLLPQPVTSKRGRGAAQTRKTRGGRGGRGGSKRRGKAVATASAGSDSN